MFRKTGSPPSSSGGSSRSSNNFPLKDVENDEDDDDVESFAVFDEHSKLVQRKRGNV
jgi:hypothetical protein